MPIRPLLQPLVFLGVLAAGTHGAEIRLHRECQPQTGVLLLGQVAHVDSEHPNEAEALCAVELGPAPAPGTKRFLRVREIQDALDAQGVNLAAHRFSGASQVLVRRPFDSPSDLAAVEGGSAVPARRDNSRPKRQQQNHQPEADTYAVSIVKALRTLPRGALLQASDVELVEGTPTDRAGKVVQAFGSLDEVVGKETTRAIAPGQVLDAGSLRPPLLVQKGEVVTVYARAAGIQVRTTARARDSGSLGDLVTVESLLDRTKYFARVSAVQEVEVYAGAVSAGPGAQEIP